MPHDMPQDIAHELDQQRVGLAVVTFMTLVHARLSEPVRVVSSPFGGNVGNHVLGGQLYGGIPFKFIAPSDDEREPRGKFEMANYNHQVGHLVEALKTRPRITFESYVARDFTQAMSGDQPARQPIGAPRRLSRYAWRTIVNVKCLTWVTGDIVSYGPELSSERASPMRANPRLFPGLWL